MSLGRILLLATLALSFTNSLCAQGTAEPEAVFRELASADPQAVEQAEARLRELWKELWSEDIRSHLPGLAQLLRAESGEVRQLAALTLAGAALNHAGSAHSIQAIAPVLIAGLSDPEPEVRRAIAATVAQMRPSPPAESTAALFDLLDDPSPSVREAALAAVVRIRPVPAELGQVLVEQVREQTSLEAYAIRALGGMKIDDPAIVSLIADRLDSPDESRRVEAVQALAHWGGTSRSALPQLRKMADDPQEDETLRMLARNAIEQIAGSGASQ